MKRDAAERLVLTRVADTVAGLGFNEFFPPQERDGWTAQTYLAMRAEFDALVKELRRRGSEKETQPKKKA